jgi:hypothetical protein
MFYFILTLFLYPPYAPPKKALMTILPTDFWAYIPILAGLGPQKSTFSFFVCYFKGKQKTFPSVFGLK